MAEIGTTWRAPKALRIHLERTEPSEREIRKMAESDRRARLEAYRAEQLRAESNLRKLDAAIAGVDAGDPA